MKQPYFILIDKVKEMLKKFIKRDYSHIDSSQIDAVAHEYNISVDIAQFLLNLTVSSGSVDGFLSCQVNHNPFLLADMDKAVSEILNVISNKGKILIFGDYDADGISASAILKLYFDSIYVDSRVVLPSRSDGYGLNYSKIESEYFKSPFDLLITVDCGVRDCLVIEEIKRELGVTVIVTDHHELPDVLPKCIVVNCKREGYPFKYLSGSGVALKLVQAIGGDSQISHFASLSAIGTVADMMPLVDENRFIVSAGLCDIKHKGILKVLDSSRCKKPYTVDDYAMRLIPRINASGRMGDPIFALNVLLQPNSCRDEDVEKLNQINAERVSELIDAVQKATINCQDNFIEGDKIVVLVDDNYKKGLIGLIASKFKDIYNLPTLVLCKCDNDYVGSGRSIDGVNLLELIESAKEYLVKFGGHFGSAGFTVKGDKLNDFIKCVKSKAAKMGIKSNNQIFYDLDFNMDMMSSSFLNELKLIEPLQPSEKPIFYIKSQVCTADIFGANKNHLQVITDCGLKLKGFFDYAIYCEALKSGAECEFIFKLEYDSFECAMVGIIQGINIVNGLRFDGIYAENFLNNISFHTDSQKVNVHCDYIKTICKNNINPSQDNIIYSQYDANQNQDKFIHSQDDANQNQDKFIHSQENKNIGQDKLIFSQDNTNLGQENIIYSQENTNLGQDKLIFSQEDKNNCQSDSINEILKQEEIIVVFESFGEYQKACCRYELDNFCVDFFVLQGRGRRVLVSPNSVSDLVDKNSYNFYNYRMLYSNGLRSLVDADEIPTFILGLSLTREICVKVYKELCSQTKAYSLKDLFEKSAMYECRYEDFLCAVKVFEELGLIKIHQPFSIERVENKHNPLTNSKLFMYSSLNNK